MREIGARICYIRLKNNRAYIKYIRISSKQDIKQKLRIAVATPITPDQNNRKTFRVGLGLAKTCLEVIN